MHTGALWCADCFSANTIVCNSFSVLPIVVVNALFTTPLSHSIILKPSVPIQVQSKAFFPCSLRVHTHLSGIVTTSSTRIACSYDDRWPPLRALIVMFTRPVFQSRPWWCLCWGLAVVLLLIYHHCLRAHLPSPIHDCEIVAHTVSPLFGAGQLPSWPLQKVHEVL
jgi:hypothetical protein